MAHLTRLLSAPFTRPLSTAGASVVATPFRSTGALSSRGASRAFQNGAAAPHVAPTRRRVWLTAAAAASGVSLYLYAKNHQKLLRVSAEAFTWEASPRPTPTPTRHCDYGASLNGMKLTLYQYQTCPFCCKARVFLDYFGISYDVVEVNSVKRTEIKWSKYRKVPLLIVETPDGKSLQLCDSSQIISLLKTYIDHKGTLSIDHLLKFYPHMEDESKGWMGSKTVYDFPNKYFMMYFDEPADEASKSTSRARSLERKWRSWVDSDFVHRISPNIYGTFGESLDAFRYFDQVGDWEKIFSWLDRMLVIYAGAFVMRLVAANLKKKHGLDDDVRGELNASVNRFVKSALKGGAQPFAGGENISMADLALYGAMTSFQGCVAFQDMMAANKIIKKWFDDVKKAVDGHEGQALVKEMAEKEGS